MKLLSPIIDGKDLVNKDYVDNSIPTNVSELNNDAEYISGLVQLSYGHSTWQDFLTAYTAKKIVYCAASSNSNPGSGSQTRRAFMAYVNNETNPTEVEFQYYRSVNTHSASQQGDQVFVYKLTNANGGTWTVVTREASSKIATSGGLTNSYASGTITINGSAKQDTLVSGTNIKTINNESLLGSGNITINPGSTYTAGTGIDITNNEISNTITSYNDLTDLPTIPTKTSDLINDSDFVVDASYVHTDNNYTTTEKNKLSGIESGAQVNTITGVKGDNESTYRTGNVNITKSNIGLGNVENKSSATIRGELTSSNVTTALGYTPINSATKGANNGVAELDANGKVPSSQLPSYVDDVLEYTSKSDFPTTGESGKIYIAQDTNLTYRWSGTAYVEISASLALGETSSTAYRGDRGKIAYDHSQSTHARTDATAVTSSITNGNIKINGTETVVYTHPTTTAVGAAAVKVGKDSNGHVVIGDALGKSDIGLGNVGNFKAVSTVASQGLTDTEKANARANIGAGTSSLTLGTTSSTAYRGDYGNTAYTHATDSSRLTTAKSSGLYKVASTSEGHIASLIAVEKSDITALGIPGSDTNTTYTLSADTTNNKVVLTPSSGTAQSITVPYATIANSATKATGDKNGDDITTTYYLASNPNGYTSNTGTITKVQANGTDIASSGTANIPAATTSKYGVTELSSATNSTSEALAATPKAVKAAYDLAASKGTGTITGVSVNGTSVATSGVANITSMPASILTGAIPSAVTATTQSASDNSTKIATTAFVKTAIDNLPEPMIFKGTLGTGGTITALPTNGSATIGDTYKVITAGTYASKEAKVGDTFICLTKTSSANTWELIPSGDEPSGTVTSITLKATSPIAIDSETAITSSGTRTLSHANSGVTAGTYRSVTVNATGHVTAGTNPTTLSGYGITDAKIASGVITLGSNTITPLTSSSTLDATKLSGTIPSGCYTNTTYTFATGDSNGQIKVTPSGGSAQNISVKGLGTAAYTASSDYAASDHNHFKLITAGDNRAVATKPNDYANNLIYQGLKNNSAIGNPSSATYSYLLGLRGWTDDSGGNAWELAFNNNGIYARKGATTEFGSWNRIDTDTKNTAGSTDTSSKIYLIGATSQAANPQTYSDNEVYATSGVLTTKSVQIGGTAATMQYNSTDKCIEFVFA